MLSCKDNPELIDGYIDGELDPLRDREIEQHLAACRPCSLEYQRRLELRAAIRSTPLYFSPPPGMEQRLRSALRREARETQPRRILWLWWPLSAAAALALVTLAIWGFTILRSRPPAEELLAQEVLSSHVRSLQATHLTDIASSDQHTVKPWFTGKLDFSPPVQDLASLGFPLIGGRLDYLAGRPAAALVYQRRQHLINLFVWPEAGAPLAAPHALTRQGYHLLSWTQAGMKYWAVSDLNENELQEFARAIRD
jgi:anti-sigma factor RsiW